MELCRATLSRPNTASPPFFIPQPHHRNRNFKRYQVACVGNSSSNSGPTKSTEERQMTISITGSTGFVGRRLVQRLLETLRSPLSLVPVCSALAGLQLFSPPLTSPPLANPHLAFPQITIVDPPPLGARQQFLALLFNHHQSTERNLKP